jgi:uncharacterized domain 1
MADTPTKNPFRETLRQAVGMQMTHTPSPVTNWLAPTLTEVGEDTLKMDFTVQEQHTNPSGNVHGGAISALLDDIIGMNVWALGREGTFVSVNLAVDFLGAAPTGTVLEASTRVVRNGRRVVNGEGEIRLKEDGRLIARATCNLLNKDLS